MSNIIFNTPDLEAHADKPPKTFEVKINTVTLGAQMVRIKRTSLLVGFLVWVVSVMICAMYQTMPDKLIIIVHSVVGTLISSLSFFFSMMYLMWINPTMRVLIKFKKMEQIHKQMWDIGFAHMFCNKRFGFDAHGM